MFKLNSFIIIFSLLLSSCSQFVFYNKSETVRLPASELEEITYYLSLDKFKYYINEYSVAFEDKVSDDIIKYLRSLSVQNIIDMDIPVSKLGDSSHYDQLIYQMLKEKSLTNGVKAADLKWNYNFFKTKLDEAFTLAPSKLAIDLSLPTNSTDLDTGAKLIPENLKAEEMTLDSGHYISNRTTRAIFWEAIENNRPIEFHLGDSREFLKELKDKNGEILFEVKPLAKNYNKIYIIQYPGEQTYRYAISNIGGQDRLDHLSHQISLSNINSQALSAKVIVKGDIKKFHAAKTEEHTLQLRLLPKADRVIIGQKESIDGKFNLFWKVKALKNLYDSNKSAFSKIPAKDMEKLHLIMKEDFETLFKEKKIIEDVFAAVEPALEKKPALLPGKFKVYNYDNFTIEMCDYVFETPDKKIVRWRVVSNVWGDEVIPIAQALKATGHTNVTYMGTAGAFATKGYKVGDLVIPKTIRDGNSLLPMKSKPMNIEGARYGGSVEHVGSPFEESQDWLIKAQSRSDFVEVETSYLRRIFNGADDNLQIYLLISDILGSDTETLAHATSSKRKNAQNKLLAELFKRDLSGVPNPAPVTAVGKPALRKQLIMETLAGKSAAFRHYTYSSMKFKTKVVKTDIDEFVSKNATFTDTFLIDRLVKIGEVIHLIKKRNPAAGEFDVAVSKSLITGTWHPKNEKLAIVIKPKNSASETALKKSMKEVESTVEKLKNFATFDVSMNAVDSNMVWLKTPEKIDPDFLLKLYTISGFKNSGIYKNITYNGNVTLDFLPTVKEENALDAFYQGSGTATASQPAVNCMQAMRALMQMI